MPLIVPALTDPQGHRRTVQTLVVITLLSKAAFMCARADDRPFLRTTHAMAGEDDESWEASTTVVSNRHGRALSLQLEHDLSTTQRLEIEWGGANHASAPESERGIRLRSLWVSSTEAGWGLATKLGVEPSRQADESRNRLHALAVVSLPLSSERLWLHANLGWQWSHRLGGTHERTGVSSLAAHWVLPTQQWLFLENARSSKGLERLTHLGLRQWLCSRQLALDLGWGRQRTSNQTGNFVSLNLSFFDLNF